MMKQQQIDVLTAITRKAMDDAEVANHPHLFRPVKKPYTEEEAQKVRDTLWARIRKLESENGKLRQAIIKAVVDDDCHHSDCVGWQQAKEAWAQLQVKG